MRILLAAILCLVVSEAYAQPNALRIGGGLINRPRDQFAITELSPTVYLDEVGSEVRAQIDRIDQLLKDEQWGEAVDALVRLSESTDHKLTRSRTKDKRGFERYVSITHYVNQCLTLIAEQDRTAYADYRTRMDPLVDRWLEDAKQRRDPRLLQKIVEEHAHSNAAAEATLLLGDLALEAGQIGMARRYWGRLHKQLQWQDSRRRLPFWVRLKRGEVVSSILRDLRPRTQKEKKLDPSSVPLVDVWARFTLASILEGNEQRGKLELDVLRKGWKDASGMLGGKKVNYLKTLSSLLNQSRLWKEPKISSDWPTFAGSVDRNAISATVVDVPLKPTWRVALRPATSQGDGEDVHQIRNERIGESKDALSSHFPIVVGDLVFVHDENRIRCLKLSDGKPAWSGEGSEGVFFTNTQLDSSTDFTFSPFGQEPVRYGEARFTLSAARSTLVASLGSNQGVGGSGNPALVGFDITTEGSVQFGPVNIEDGTWSFHGAPVCERNRCWVGLRQRNVTSQDFVVCIDTVTGEELWRTKICSADSLGHNSTAEASNYLLTKHEDTVYFSSHLGTVAALDADRGRVRWVTKYPRKSPKRSNILGHPWHALRDLTPCLYYEGLLVVAPSDSSKIFAFHADSGKLLWQTEFGGDANQLLGVGEIDHLIVSGRRLWWIDVYTGSLSKEVDVNPFPSGTTSQPNGAGRGVLSGGNVYWPTVDDDSAGKIFVLRQSDGTVVRQPIDLEAGGVEPGNLVVTPTHLLIASSRELVAYRIDTR